METGWMLFAFLVAFALNGAKADCTVDMSKNQTAMDCYEKFTDALRGNDMEVNVTPNNAMMYYRRLCATNETRATVPCFIALAKQCPAGANDYKALGLESTDVLHQKCALVMEENCIKDRFQAANLTGTCSDPACNTIREKCHHEANASCGSPCATSGSPTTAGHNLVAIVVTSGVLALHFFLF